MPLILAIDADQPQSAALAALVRTHLSAELVQATSAGEGLLALGDRVPDLILTSALLPPFDDGVLDEYLRELGPSGARVQTLRIPVISRAPSAAGRTSLPFLRKRREALTEGCDPAVFAEEIGQYLKGADRQADSGNEGRISGAVEPVSC